MGVGSRRYHFRAWRYREQPHLLGSRDTDTPAGAELLEKHGGPPDEERCNPYNQDE